MRYQTLVAFVTLVFSATLVVGQETGRVSAIKANLRGTPSGTGVVITTVSNGEAFDLIKHQAPWYLIQTSTYVGWIHGNGITLDSSSAEEKAADAFINRVLGPSRTPAVPSSPPEIVRYETGTNLISEENVGGRGSLQVTNGTNSDAIAKLADSITNRTVRLVYIRAGTVATISSIRQGNYVLKFSLGTGYDRSAGKFTAARSFSRFDEVLDFYETRVGGSIRWKDFEVTLNPVVGGNASTSPISAAEFDGP